jgi:hypothetical protein
MVTLHLMTGIAATAIPNATISWWYNNIEIGREDKDINYQIIGQHPSPPPLLVLNPMVATENPDKCCTLPPKLCRS